MKRLLALALLLPTLAWADYNSVIRADLPCHYYRMDAASGTTETDTITSIAPGCALASANATYSGGVTLNQTGALVGDSNKAVLFTRASSGKMITGGSEDFKVKPSVAGWSIEFWAKPLDATNYKNVMVGSDDVVGVVFALAFTNTAQLSFTTFQDAAGCNDGAHGSTGSVSSYSASTWYHVVGTTHGAGGTALTSMQLYQDAALISTVSSFTGNVCAGSVPLLVAKYPSFGNFFDGPIDEVAVYPYELTQAQVTAHHNAGLGLSAAGSRLPFTVRYFERPHRLAPTTIAWSMPSLAVDIPGFLIDRMNQQAIRSYGIYAQ